MAGTEAVDSLGPFLLRQHPSLTVLSIQQLTTIMTLDEDSPTVTAQY